MAVSYQIGAPLGTGTLLADMETKPGGPQVTIKNTHATETLYLGGDENASPQYTTDDLTITTGFPVAAGASVTFQLGAGDKIYGRGSLTTATITVAVFRTNARVG